MRIFVDTNLLLDVLAKREPFYAAAARVWTLAETGVCEAPVSAISFNNVFDIIRKAHDTDLIEPGTFSTVGRLRHRARGGVVRSCLDASQQSSRGTERVLRAARLSGDVGPHTKPTGRGACPVARQEPRSRRGVRASAGRMLQREGRRTGGSPCGHLRRLRNADGCEAVGPFGLTLDSLAEEEEP
ncbi:PIN domain-containing protein [Thiocapsa bogorovii]|uniref:PIN domain-containing protein n=1 Tax=Thiocapsa bogorovii TaxID=521689 RepID=UPI0038CD8D51